MKTEQTKRIGIITADPLRGVGLLAILEGIEGMTPVPLEVPHLLSKELSGDALDAAVLDARSAGTSLDDLLQRLRRQLPALKIIVLGESAEPRRVQKVIGAGAKGFLAETAGEDEIRMALDVVLDGSVWAPRKVLARLIEAGGVSGSATQPNAGASVAGCMTPREMEVLELLKDGKSNREIARSMGIDETTVKAHLGRMLRKTGASNRVELTLRAVDEGRWAEHPE